MHCKLITTLTVNHVTSLNVQYDSRVISFLSLVTLPTVVPFDMSHEPLVLRAARI